MLISLPNVLNSIYASSALTTMSPMCEAPLLHPDHEKALRQIITDSMHLLITRLPSTFRLLRIDETGFVFDIPADANSNAIARAIEALLARMSLSSIGHAAGISQHLLDTLINTLPLSPNPIFITPCI